MPVLLVVGCRSKHLTQSFIFSKMQHEMKEKTKMLAVFSIAVFSTEFIMSTFK